MASFQDRVVGALRLQAATFEDVEHDPTAVSQAAIVVLAVARGRRHRVDRIRTATPVSAIVAILFGLIGWAVSSAVVWLVGTRLMPGKNTEADYGQLLRVVGFAQAPGLFTVLGIIPILGWLVRIVVWVWTLVALVIAVRQALDYDDTSRRSSSA